MKTKLSINLNAIALLRNRRNLPWPDMLEIARIGMQAGANGITIHPRPDQRHIRFSDVSMLGKFLADEFKEKEFNIEGYPSKEFLELASEYANQITLVPDGPEQTTSDHGWDLVKQKEILAEAVKIIRQAEIKQRRKIAISIFIDPGLEDFTPISDLAIDKIEVYTGPYAMCFNDLKKAEIELEKLFKTAMAANSCGFAVNAGHDLTIDNLPALLEKIKIINEVSIGHAFTSDMLIYGIKDSTKRYLKILEG